METPKPAPVPKRASPAPVSRPPASPPKQAARPAPVSNPPVQQAASTPAPQPQTPAPAPPREPDPVPAPPQPASEQPADIAAAPPRILRPDPAAEKPREPHTVTIPAGTLITVRLREALSTEKHSDGDPFQATLDQPLVVDGFVLAERGALTRGRVVSAVRAGRVKGRASLAIELMQLNTSDGQKVEIKTDTFTREAEASTGKDAAKVGVAAGIGAAIGAIFGGGKGAAIGGAIGGASGAGGVLATRGEEAKLPSETRLTFRLKEPVTLTEKLKE
jgi:hypothetical protein